MGKSIPEKCKWNFKNCRKIILGNFPIHTVFKKTILVVSHHHIKRKKSIAGHFPIQKRKKKNVDNFWICLWTMLSKVKKIFCRKLDLYVDIEKKENFLFFMQHVWCYLHLESKKSKTYLSLSDLEYHTFLTFLYVKVAWVKCSINCILLGFNFFFVKYHIEDCAYYLNIWRIRIINNY